MVLLILYTFPILNFFGFYSNFYDLFFCLLQISFSFSSFLRRKIIDSVFFFSNIPIKCYELLLSTSFSCIPHILISCILKIFLSFLEAYSLTYLLFRSLLFNLKVFGNTLFLYYLFLVLLCSERILCIFSIVLFTL